MLYYPILLGSTELANVDGLSARRERYMFQRGQQSGAMTLTVGRNKVCHRAETTAALEARGMSSAKHRRYLRRLPDSMPLDDAVEAFNLSAAGIKSLGVVEDNGMVNVREAFEALGLDTNLLGNTDN